MYVEAAAQPGSRTNPERRAQGTIAPFQYLAVVAQLAVLTVLLRQFQIESGGFLRLALLTFAGFAVHAVLPLRYRLPFFLALSLGGIVLVMNVGNAAWIVTIGLMLVGLCHLPIAFRWRSALLIVAGVVLAAMRARWVPAPVSDAIWPILGSMFMFRTIVYMYDLSHASRPASPVSTLAYFFMLPNACFPLFPVVDSEAFKRNYFKTDAYRTYQRGIDWMVRGVIHLLLYRYIYYELALAPAEIVSPAMLVQYLLTNFLLYLRVSGLFHLIVGMLYLFGFELPETHHRYLLAASFTDFWRRINIYWKDFMQKVFYYPAVFRLKSLGMTRAMVLGTLWVFAMTWALHAYQWFWLRGTMLLAPQDVLFWAILAVLVVINGLIELRRGPKRTLSGADHNWRRLLSRAARTYATFWVICIIWSFWTTESVTSWLSMWSVLRGGYTIKVLLFPSLMLAVIVLGTFESHMPRGKGAVRLQSHTRDLAVTVASMLVLIAVSVEAISTQVGPQFATMVTSLRSGRLSRLDVAKLERGYYENLLSVDQFNSQLWEVYSKRPETWLDVRGTALKRFTADFAQMELIPSFASQTNYGTVSINRWGMRDQDYSQTPSQNTFRMAMLGASTVMGWGVADGETFESLMEARLNHDGTRGGYSHYEILNFGVPGYQPPQDLVSADKAMRFKPNAVIYVATGRELSRAADYLSEVVHKRIAIPYAPLAQVVAKAGLTAELDDAAAAKQLRPYQEELLASTYGLIAARIRAGGATPVFVFLPQVQAGSWDEETPETLRIAAAAGFIVIDLSDVFAGHSIESIRLAEWDDHPNAKGHRLVAERLYDAISRRPDILPARGEHQLAHR
jgi:D-alanyl-lipoteichoic acid acyltransferase DltB (MBOAT superfamily)